VPDTDLTARWNAYPLWASGQGPMARGGKHGRLAYDSKRKRMVLTGGDRDESDNGNPSVWAFTAGGGATRLSPMCRPYPDWLPSFPDNVTWTYDSKRDRMIIMPGFFMDLPRVKAVCGRDDDRVMKFIKADGTKAKDGGVFNLTTNAWNQRTWPFPVEIGGYGGDQHTNWGIYDPRTDTVLRFFWNGSNNLQKLNLTTNTWSMTKLGDSSSIERRRSAQTFATLSQPALDVQGRSIYVVAGSTLAVRQPDGTTKNVFEGRLLRVNVDTLATERIPLPAGYVWPNVGDGGVDKLLVFDPIRRVLIHPRIPTLAGDVSAIYLSHVDQGHRWSVVPLPANRPPLKGNVAGMDTDRGALVLMGGHSSTLSDGSRTPPPSHYWTLTLIRG
jgi:hypothetical protein